MYWLVVWNTFYFSIYWEESSQLTFIFFRGLKPPTSVKLRVYPSSWGFSCWHRGFHHGTRGDFSGPTKGPSQALRLENPATAMNAMVDHHFPGPAPASAGPRAEWLGGHGGGDEDPQWMWHQWLQGQQHTQQEKQKHPMARQARQMSLRPNTLAAHQSLILHQRQSGHCQGRCRIQFGSLYRENHHKSGTCVHQGRFSDGMIIHCTHGV